MESSFKKGLSLLIGDDDVLFYCKSKRRFQKRNALLGGDNIKVKETEGKTRREHRTCTVFQFTGEEKV